MEEKMKELSDQHSKLSLARFQATHAVEKAQNELDKARRALDIADQELSTCEAELRKAQG
jgi:hypothetical protein